MSEEEKEKVIKKEIRKLKKINKNVPENKKIYVNRLIEQCAFMYVTLDELQKTINETGAVELFVNGAQKMLREHPACKIYNQMIKNYSSSIKQLIEISPEIKESDELMSFLNKHKE